MQALRKGNNDDSLHRIQELQTLLMENSQQKERLTGFMAQGYIDQILYNRENNALLSQADGFRADIEALRTNMTGDMSRVREAERLLHFTEKEHMLTAFDDILFAKASFRRLAR